jgi:AhpD family alkylhydroperoxidase
MTDRVQDFRSYRERMNKRILSVDNRAVKRFFGVDTLTYEPGALSSREKEMLGLVASMVLRCDDCVSYHIEQCKKEGVTSDQFFDIFSVALTVGGSIVIPHLRRAVEYLDRLDGHPEPGA